MPMGNIKWLFLATLLCVFAVIIMLAGLFRNNKIANRMTDIPEEAAGNIQQGKKIFAKHAAIAAVLIALAAVIAFTLGKN